mmetsp:Transcript_82961/g.165612  ORF Transcript_82961/g.165612 Transcript_82961/m.165612 type:complete len:413 (-) Transcript_82961:205-1443(-)
MSCLEASMALTMRFGAPLAVVLRCLSRSSVLPSVETIQAALNEEGHYVSLEESRLLLGSVIASSERASYSATVVECTRRLKMSVTKGGAECDTMQSAGVRIIAAPIGTRWERDGILRGQAEWLVPAQSNEIDSRRRIVFCHGGGYCRYSADDPVYRSFCSRVALSTGLPVLSIDYRLAPEHGAPAALEDVLTAVEWAWDNGPDGAEPAAHVILGGDSAGGGLVFGTFAACFLGTQLDGSGVRTNDAFTDSGTNSRPPSALWGLSPWTDLTCSLPSYTSRAWDEASGTGDPLYASPPQIEIELNQRAADAYVGKHDRTDSRLSPIFMDAGILRALPPTLLQVGDSEILLCDSTEFAARALNAGASSVQLLVYRGMWHCWPMYSQLAKDACKEPLAEAQWALEDLSRFLSKLNS